MTCLELFRLAVNAAKSSDPIFSFVKRWTCDSRMNWDTKQLISSDNDIFSLIKTMKSTNSWFPFKRKTKNKSKKIVAADSPKDDQNRMCADAFMQNNQLDHITQLMGYHPHYLDCFLRTQQFLLREDGPLPYHYRHYIAIMAAGRHQCSFLISLYVQEYVLCGGDPAWLNGLDHIPKKLRDLYEINKILAHRPWLITKSHIENLTKGKDNWSVSELVHALILLSHFHALCSFVYGCGIASEVEQAGGYILPDLPVTDANCNSEASPPRKSSTNSVSQDDLGICVLMERMKKLTEEEEGAELTQEEMLKQFQNVETQSAELTTNTETPSPKENVLKFVVNADFVYQDFAKRSYIEEIPTFRAQEYSWEDHGFSLANRYYSDIGSLLDEKFSCAYNLTYYTMGDHLNVDTTMFRRAVWNYIHCMYGIRHDDYNYAEVNQMLERDLKAYIKTVTCYPERLTKIDYENVMQGFKHSEKKHISAVRILETSPVESPLELILMQCQHVLVDKYGKEADNTF